MQVIWTDKREQSLRNSTSLVITPALAKKTHLAFTEKHNVLRVRRNGNIEATTDGTDMA